MKARERDAAIEARRRRTRYRQACEDLIRWTDLEDPRLLSHARRELPAAADDDEQHAINRHLLALVACFTLEFATADNAFVRSYTEAKLHELLRFRPLTPLTGAREEWSAVNERHGHCVNLRMPSVLLEPETGRAFWLDGYVFYEPPRAPGAGHHMYTSVHSHRPIESFPWSPPEPALIAVNRDADGPEQIAAIRAAGYEPFEVSTPDG